MEVFNIKSGKVEIIEQTPFKLEREIQDVIEKNTNRSTNRKTKIFREFGIT